jgi:hypothetical protein
MCRKDALGHLISHDSVGEPYVDSEAGDFLCFECEKKETKKLRKEAKTNYGR